MGLSEAMKREVPYVALLSLSNDLNHLESMIYDTGASLSISLAQWMNSSDEDKVALTLTTSTCDTIGEAPLS